MRVALRSDPLSAIAFCLSLILSADAAFATQKPNVIVILTDDLGYGDFGCYGAEDIATPHVDRMAREGMRFTLFYVNRVCSPSLAALLTGCHAQRVDINGVLFECNAVGLSEESFGIWRIPRPATCWFRVARKTSCVVGTRRR